MKFAICSFLALVAAIPGFASPITLGAASNFAILADTKAMTTGNFFSNGEVGSTTAPTGFTGVVTTTNVGSTGTSGTPLGDAFAAYNAAAAASPATAFTSLQTVLTPGVYHDGGSATLNGTYTFNGAGQYIIQIGGSLQDNAATFVLSGGATASNIFFQVAGSTTLYGVLNPGTEPGAVFQGVILSDGSVAVDGPGTFDGNIISVGGAVTSYGGSNPADAVTVNVPTPEPSSMGLLGLGIAAVGLGIRRGIRASA